VDTYNPAMLIRSATNADAQAVRELVLGVLGEYGLLAEHEGVDTDLADIEANYIACGGLFDLVFDESAYGQPPHGRGSVLGEMLIGTVGLYPRGGGVAELRKMYLLKSARGKGLGKMLLERVLGRARGLGFRRLELETSSKLIEAIGLYRKYGFKPFSPDHIACRCDQAYALDLD
jgi:putative acetyltransferase